MTLLLAAARAVASSVMVRAVWLADDLFVLRRCACGHPAEAHEHYRAGSECGICGPGVESTWGHFIVVPCTRYRYRPFTRRS